MQLWLSSPNYWQCYTVTYHIIYYAYPTSKVQYGPTWTCVSLLVAIWYKLKATCFSLSNNMDVGLTRGGQINVIMLPRLSICKGNYSTPVPYDGQACSVGWAVYTTQTCMIANRLSLMWMAWGAFKFTFIYSCLAVLIAAELYVLEHHKYFISLEEKKKIPPPTP
jgi:hypothetical protein